MGLLSILVNQQDKGMNISDGAFDCVSLHTGSAFFTKSDGKKPQEWFAEGAFSYCLFSLLNDAIARYGLALAQAQEVRTGGVGAAVDV